MVAPLRSFGPPASRGAPAARGVGPRSPRVRLPRPAALALALALLAIAFVAWRAARAPRLGHPVDRAALLLPATDDLLAAIAVRDAPGAIEALLGSAAFREAEAREPVRVAVDALLGGAAGRLRTAAREHPDAVRAVLGGDAALAIYPDGPIASLRATGAARAALRGASVLGGRVTPGPFGDGSYVLALGREPLLVVSVGEHLVVAPASSRRRLEVAVAQARGDAPSEASAALAAALLADGEALGVHLGEPLLGDMNVAALDVGARPDPGALRLRVGYQLATVRRAPGRPEPDAVGAVFPPSTPLYVAVNDGPFFFENHGGDRVRGLARLLAQQPAAVRADLAGAGARFSFAWTGLVDRGREPPAPTFALALDGDAGRLGRGLEGLLAHEVSPKFVRGAEEGAVRPVVRFSSAESPFRPGVAQVEGGAVLATDVGALDALKSGAHDPNPPAAAPRALALRGDGAALARLGRRLLVAEAARLAPARASAVADALVPVLDALPALGAIEGALDTRADGAAGELHVALAP